MRKVTVLVSAAGSTNGVNVIKALRSQDEYDVRIVAIDCDADAAGLYLADLYDIAPTVSAPAFEDFVLEFCERHGVDIIMPTHSVELPFYSRNRHMFHGRGIRLMVAPPEQIETCSDKLKLAEFFNRSGIRHPRIYDEADSNGLREDVFPLFVKSRFGSGSSYARKVANQRELSFYLSETPNPIVQEYVEGTEYTVNILSDQDGKVVGLVPLKRVKVEGGLAVVAEVELDTRIMREATSTVETLGLIGPSNVQVMKSGEELVFLEINPRFACGGMPLATAAGLNIPLLMIRLMLGEPIGELKIDATKRMIRYWDAIVLGQDAESYPGVGSAPKATTGER